MKFTKELERLNRKAKEEISALTKEIITLEQEIASCSCPIRRYLLKQYLEKLEKRHVALELAIMHFQALRRDQEFSKKNRKRIRMEVEAMKNK